SSISRLRPRSQRALPLLQLRRLHAPPLKSKGTAIGRTHTSHFSETGIPPTKWAHRVQRARPAGHAFPTPTRYHLKAMTNSKDKAKQATKPPIYLLDSMAFIFRAYHAMQR